MLRYRWHCKKWKRQWIYLMNQLNASLNIRLVWWISGIRQQGKRSFKLFRQSVTMLPLHSTLWCATRRPCMVFCSDDIWEVVILINQHSSYQINHVIRWGGRLDLWRLNLTSATRRCLEQWIGIGQIYSVSRWVLWETPDDQKLSPNKKWHQVFS